MVKLVTRYIISLKVTESIDDIKWRPTVLKSAIVWEEWKFMRRHKSIKSFLTCEYSACSVSVEGTTCLVEIFEGDGEFLCIRRLVVELVHLLIIIRNSGMVWAWWADFEKCLKWKNLVFKNITQKLDFILVSLKHIHYCFKIKIYTYLRSDLEIII